MSRRSSSRSVFPHSAETEGRSQSVAVAVCDQCWCAASKCRGTWLGFRPAYCRNCRRFSAGFPTSDLNLRRWRFMLYYEVHSEGTHPLYGALSWQGLEPIKLAYNPSRLDGQLILTASALNWLQSVCLQSWSQGLLLHRTWHFFQGWPWNVLEFKNAYKVLVVFWKREGLKNLSFRSIVNEMSDERRSIVDSNCIWLLVATNNIVIDCEPRATLAFHPYGVSKSVVIHVII